MRNYHSLINFRGINNWILKLVLFLGDGNIVLPIEKSEHVRLRWHSGLWHFTFEEKNTFQFQHFIFIRVNINLLFLLVKCVNSLANLRHHGIVELTYWNSVRNPRRDRQCSYSRSCFGFHLRIQIEPWASLQVQERFKIDHQKEERQRQSKYEFVRFSSIWICYEFNSYVSLTSDILCLQKSSNGTASSSESKSKGSSTPKAKSKSNDEKNKKNNPLKDSKNTINTKNTKKEQVKNEIPKKKGKENVASNNKKELVEEDGNIENFPHIHL